MDFIIRLYPGEGAKESIARILGHTYRKRKTQQLAPPETPQRAQQSSGGEKMPQVDEQLLTELMNRKITEKGAKKLLTSLTEDQQVLDQLEWGDFLLSQAAPGSYRNPPGLYVTLIRDNVAVPENFQTSRKRKLWEEARAAKDRAELERLEMEEAYSDYQSREVDKFITSSLNEEEYKQYVEGKKQELLSKHRYTASWSGEMLETLAISGARREIANRITFDTFETFCEGERQRRAQLNAE
jgi:hypothetical protein